MAKNRNIKVVLNDDDEKFLKALAERDGIDLQREMRQLFYLQLREEMELYEEELRGNQ